MKVVGHVGEPPPKAPVARPNRAAWSEVARTAAVYVKMKPNAAGAARIVVDVAGSAERDAIIDAIRKARS